MVNDEKGCPVSLANASLPSGIQAKALGFAPWPVGMAAPSHVSRRAIPPRAGTRCISALP